MNSGSLNRAMIHRIVLGIKAPLVHNRALGNTTDMILIEVNGSHCLLGYQLDFSSQRNFGSHQIPDSHNFYGYQMCSGSQIFLGYLKLIFITSVVHKNA